MKILKHGVCVPDKAGWRPREQFFEWLGKLHPRIVLGWVVEAQQWAIAQRVPGGMHLVFWCGRRPAERWILTKLRKCQISALSPTKLRMLMDDLDHSEESIREAALKASSPRFQEGADRIYSAVGSEIRVSMAGTNGNHRKQARRGGPGSRPGSRKNDVE